MSCPYCAAPTTTQMGRRTTLGYRMFRCRACRRTCNERTGTLRCMPLDVPKPEARRHSHSARKATAGSRGTQPRSRPLQPISAKLSPRRCQRRLRRHDTALGKGEEDAGPGHASTLTSGRGSSALLQR